MIDLAEFKFQPCSPCLCFYIHGFTEVCASFILLSVTIFSINELYTNPVGLGPKSTPSVAFLGAFIWVRAHSVTCDSNVLQKL